MRAISEFLSATDSLTAILLALIVLGAGLRRITVRTIGSRRDLSRKLNGLTVGNPIEYVERLFGDPVLTEIHSGKLPPWRSQEQKVVDLEYRLYNVRHGWLTAHMLDGVLVGYGFTVSDRKFRHDLRAASFGQMTGSLGRSTFEQIKPGLPQDANTLPGYASAIGYYAERWYAGGPGQYHQFGLASTFFGLGGFPDPELIDRVGIGAFIDTTRDLAPDDEQSTALVAYRRTHRPNTFSVLGPPNQYPALHSSPGADSAVVGDNTMVRFTVGPKGWRSQKR